MGSGGLEPLNRTYVFLTCEIFEQLNCLQLPASIKDMGSGGLEPPSTGHPLQILEPIILSL